jgi:fumarate reductase subunit C
VSARAETLLWLVQRASAAVLGAAVVVHITTVVFAVQGGLTADEVLSRLRGSGGWLAFYLVFVAAAAVHAPIGLRTILREWTPVPHPAADLLSIAFAILLFALGAHAAFGLYGLGGA